MDVAHAARRPHAGAGVTAAGVSPRESVTLADALGLMRARFAPSAMLERVPLRDALDRILGTDVMPAHTDSAPLLVVGRRIRATDLGLLAAAGRVEVPVRRRLRVAIFSAGQALRSPGGPLAAGEARDSNRYLLGAMLRQFGADTLDLGVVRDDPDALRAAFMRAGAEADVVITGGGVSIRSPTPVRELLQTVGDIDFWSIRIKPGRPLPCGRLHGGAVFFGLSSNPIPTSVTFHQVVRPVLDHLAGAAPRTPLALQARCRGRLDAAPGLRHFLRGQLAHGADGALEVARAAPGTRGVTRVMRDADCFIVLPEDSGPVEPGQMVRVEPFTGLIRADVQQNPFVTPGPSA
jgi:molybdopterin molybdotransferase